MTIEELLEIAKKSNFVDEVIKIFKDAGFADKYFDSYETLLNLIREVANDY